MHGLLEKALCPAGEMDSGMCSNPRVRLFLDMFVHACVGVSAGAVELAAAVTAPSSKERATWTAFTIGGVIAVAFGAAAGAYGEAVTALLAGLIAAVVITRHVSRTR